MMNTETYFILGLVLFRAIWSYQEPQRKMSFQKMAIDIFELFAELVLIVMIALAMTRIPLDEKIKEIVIASFVLFLTYFLERFRQKGIPFWVSVVCLSFLYISLWKTSFELGAGLLSMLQTCLMLLVGWFVTDGLGFRIVLAMPPRSIKGLPFHLLVLCLVLLVLLGLQRVLPATLL